MLSMDIVAIPEAEVLKTKLLESLLSQNIRTNPYDIRYIEVFFNNLNGYLAFRLRFHNNSNRDVVLSPNQFTLVDSEDRSYKFDLVAAKKGNYKGLLEGMKINPDRFATGLLVFDTDIRKSPVMSKMIWQDDLGNTYTKLFPKIPVTEIKFE